jgi:hypothetical protein
VTAAGDEMSEWLWDGPLHEDEEIEGMLLFKNGFEKELGVEYSKSGLKRFIEKILNHESPKNTEDPATAKLWASGLDKPNIKVWIKTGGSQFSDS